MAMSNGTFPQKFQKTDDVFGPYAVIDLIAILPFDLLFAAAETGKSRRKG